MLQVDPILCLGVAESWNMLQEKNIILGLLKINLDFWRWYRVLKFSTSSTTNFLRKTFGSTYICFGHSLIEASLSEMNLGGGKIFCTFDTPYHPCLIAFLRKNFRKFSKFVLLIPPIFFEKFPKISIKFVEIFQLLQNRKNNIIFELKMVQNHCINQNLDKFSPNSTKTANFS